MGQAQSGTEEALEGHEPSRHVKVSADLLIPPNIVIDDIEMLQAVQRRIERGALAPFLCDAPVCSACTDVVVCSSDSEACKFNSSCSDWMPGCTGTAYLKCNSLRLQVVLEQPR